MFQSYIEQVRKNAKMEEKTEHSPWDDYIDRQLEHLVVEYYFDFQQITRYLIGLASEGGQKKITKKRVQERWKYLHLKRLRDREKTEEQKHMDRIAKSILKMEDPRKNLKVNDLIKTLPQSRQNKDFLAVSIEEIQNAKYTDSNGQKCTPTTFNVLKDSIKGIKDEKEREKQFKKLEMDFLQNLEKVQVDEPDQQMQEKPLIFRAKFISNTNFIVEREEMTQEHVQRLLAQKVNLSEMNAPEPQFCPQMDNFVSRFAKPEEQVKKKEIEEVKKEETDTQTEQEDQSESKKKQKQQDQLQQGDDLDDIQIEKKMHQFEQVQYGSISIDDTISQYEDMRSQVKKLDIFDIGKAGQQSQSSLLDQLQNIQTNPSQSSTITQQTNQQQQQQQRIETNIQNIENNKQEQQMVIEELYNDDEIYFKKQQQDQKVIQQQTQQQLDPDNQKIITPSSIESQKIVEKESAESLNQFSKLIHEELASFQQQKIKQKTLQIEETSSEEEGEESDDDELDFLELCRLNLKSDDPQSSQIQERINQMKEEKKRLKSEKGKKGKKKVMFGEQNVIGVSNTLQDVNIQNNNLQGKNQLEKALNEEEEGKAPKEWNDLTNEEKFFASLEFQKKQQEDEELQKKKEIEKQRDLQEIQQIESRFADLQEEREKKKKEERQKKLDEQVRIQAEKQKEEEKLKKEEEQKFFEEQFLQQQKQEKEKTEQAIKDKTLEIESQIKGFKLVSSPTYLLFDECISYLQQISGLPQQIKKKFKNFKNYEITRDSITSRYQILIFPYVDNVDFTMQFLAFFMRNSFFKHPPSEEEFGDINDDQNSPQTSQDQQKPQIIQYPRLSTHGFPFCLVSFSFGCYSPNLKDEPDAYLSEYLNVENQQKLQTEITDNKLTKCIYLFFDTELGRGDQILTKQLDVCLGDIIDKKIIEKAKRDLNSNQNCDAYGGSGAIFQNDNLKLNPDTKLHQFMIEHQKSMELATKIFCETQTFHGICPSETMMTDKAEVQSIIIVRNFCEIASFGHIGGVQSIDNTTMSQSELVSAAQENQSITALSEQRFIPHNSVVQHLIRRLFKCGLQIIGMKSFYFNEETSNEFSNNIEKVKFDCQNNKPVICIAVSGHNAFEKLKRIVGPEDTILAKKLDPNSLNALFAQGRDDCIITPYNKVIAKKMLSYFFGSRIQRINSLQQIDILEGKVPKKVLYLFKPKASNPIFYITLQPMQEYIMLFSHQINPGMFGRVFEIFKKRGIRVLDTQMISDKHIELMLSQVKDKEQLNSLLLSSLSTFSFSSPTYSKSRHSLNLIIKVFGHNIKSLRNKILNKVFRYNSLIHPSKKDLIFFTCNSEIKYLFETYLLTQKACNQQESIQQSPEKLQEHQDQIQTNVGTIMPNPFTEYAKFPHFVVIWSFLSQHHKDNGLDFKAFTEGSMELISMKRISPTQEPTNEQFFENIRYMLYNNNLNLNKMLKKKQEFANYCRKLAATILKEDFVFAAFRLQEELDATKKEKFFDYLLNQPSLVNSNQKVSENLIYKLGGKSSSIPVSESDDKEFPYEFFEILFFEVSLPYLKEVSKNINAQLYDDPQFKNSFIYDVPSSLNNNNQINTILIFSPEVMTLLSLNGVIKRLEGEQFQIQVCVQCRVSSEMADTICDNLTRHFQVIQQVQDQSGQIQKISYKIELLQEMFEKHKFWCLLIKRENAIFLGKRILREFAEKYAVFKKEDFSWKNLEQLAEYQLTYGMYCTNNLQDHDKEVTSFKTMLNQLNSVYEPENIQVDSKDQQKIFIMIRFDEVIETYGIYEFLAKMQELKLRVDNFSINQHLTKDAVNYISNLFSPKFDAKAINAHIQNINLEEVSFAFILADIKQSIHLSDAFGTFRLNEKGEFIQLIKGQLKFNNFLIYSENAENNQIERSNFN